MDRRERLFEAIRLAELDLAAGYLPATGRVLELGGGPGFVTGQLLELLPNSRITVVERDPVLIERARKYLGEKREGRLEIIEGDIMRMDLPDNSFDFAFARLLFQHLPDPVSAAREALRVLRPGGHLVIYCPDEQRFRAHCQATGQPYNPHHKHADFSLAYVKNILIRLGQDRFIYENPDVDQYSWDLVCVKKAAAA